MFFIKDDIDFDSTEKRKAGSGVGRRGWGGRGWR